MKNHEGCRRAFCWSSRAWYAEAAQCKGSITFGMYADEGGTSGEMTMEWKQIQGGRPPSPQLQAFDDSWSALALFSDVIARMGEVDDQSIDESQFVDILLSCGFEDQTQYEEDPERREVAEQVKRIRELEAEADGIREAMRGRSAA